MERVLVDLSHLFMQMIKPCDTPWKDIVSGLKKKDIDQSAIIAATIYNPVVKLYPPSTRYIKTFMKRLISELEENDMEVIDEIYSAYIGLVSRTLDEEEFHYCTYTVNQHLRITLRETKNLITEGTTGLTTWSASHALVQYILQNSANFKSKRILELGSGLGLTGLVLIKACNPISYTFTDHHPKVLEYLRHNVTLNLPSMCIEMNGNKEGGTFCWQGSDVHIDSLDWESPSHLQEYDYIIGADILFDSTLIPHLVNVLKTCSASVNGRVLIAATLRNEKTLDLFMKEAAERGLKLDYVEERGYQESASQPKALVNIMSFSLRRNV